jgi:hypothetical protein
VTHTPRARIYELYSDFVMKNPFYEVEQVRLLLRYTKLVGADMLTAPQAAVC